ncbi:hypothetical protein QUW15_05935 [Desulfovibrio piger]|nr:hypothetical protein [Desulfovibrio piger]
MRIKPAFSFWSDRLARRVPSRPGPGCAGRGGLLRPAGLSVLCLLSFLVFPPWLSARAESAFEPVALRVVVPQAAQGEEREILYWRAVGQGWLRALALVAPRLPGVGEIAAGPFPAQFRLALAAAASDISRGALRVCEPPSEPGVPLDTAGTPSMCVLRPGAITITVRALPDARDRISRLLADNEQAAVWQRLLTEMEQAVRILGTDGADAEHRRAAACAVQALLGDVRQLLPEAADGWLAGAQSMPLLEDLAERVPESALVRLLLAEARLRAGLPQQCMEAASAALRRAPDMTRARYVRALAHWRLQQLALAEEDLDAALRATPAPVGSAAHDARRRGILRARGALRMLRGNTEGMCEDLTAACALGDCEGLAAVRGRGQCLPPDGLPDSASDSLPPRLPALDVEARRDVPVWPPVTAETARAVARQVPVRVYPLPDPFVFSPRP